MKDLECPNCGSANPATISEGKYRCEFCDTVFINEAILQRHHAAEKQANRLKAEQLKAMGRTEQAKAVNNTGKRAVLFAAVALVFIGGGVAYMASKSMNESKKAQEDLIKTLQQSAQEIKKDTIKQ